MVSLNRVVMQKSSRKMIQRLNPETLDVAEVSGKWGQQFAFRSYTQFKFPEHDICKGPIRNPDRSIRTFDLVLANQVWEHLDRPYTAARSVFTMLRPGGHFWLAVPFFVPFHAAPYDCARWSARGLRSLLLEAGFQDDAIVTEQWGNKNAALRNLEDEWPPTYNPETDSLENDPDMPVCAWAIAQRR